MGPSTTSSRLPLPLVLLLAAAFLVLGALVARAAVGVFIWFVQLGLIMLAFLGIGFAGLYLWRKGDLSDR
ncbi:MAG: hypothetical protein AAGD35_02935 [Actinomycetota bacterium]